MERQGRNHIAVSLFLCVVVVTALRGQSNDRTIESLLEHSSSDEDIRTTADYLESLTNDPVDVAHPVYGELMRIPMVSPLLAESMILFSDTVEINDVDQYRSAALMTDELLERIKPFITMRNQSSFLTGGIFPEKAEVRMRIEPRVRTGDATSDEDFRGSPVTSYQRCIVSGEHLRSSLVFERDAGEVSGDGFLSGSLMLNNLGALRRIVIGDFTPASDQGLVFSRSATSSKGNDAVGQIRKRGSVLTPSTSTDEFNLFRGVGSEFIQNGISLFVFYSKIYQGASLDSNGAVTSFYTSGLYRNENELLRKNTVGLTSAGGRIGVDIIDGHTVSLSLLRSEYSREVMLQSKSVSPKKQSAGSIGYTVHHRSFELFTESAMDSKRRFAWCGGLTVLLMKHFTIAYHYRNYSSGYRSPFAHPFSLNGTTSTKEFGDYIGVEFEREQYRVNLFMERIDLPEDLSQFTRRNLDIFCSFEYTWRKKNSVTVHYRRKLRDDENRDPLSDTRGQHNYRVELRHTASKDFILTSRIEMNNVEYLPSGNNEKGLLFFVDGDVKGPFRMFRIRGRLIFFDTPSYDSRIYQFESDVRGNISNPPLYGKGIRWYLVFGSEPTDGLLCSVKVASGTKMKAPFVKLPLGSADLEQERSIVLQLDFQM